VIEDLEGAAPEPSRRGHVAMLSAAVAAVSLLLLFALIMPPQLAVGPQAAAPAPSAVAAPGLTIFSGPTTSFPSGSPFVPGDGRRVSECASETGSGGSYIVVYNHDGSQVIGAFSMGRAGASPPTAPYAYVGTGWLTASCAAIEDVDPRIDRAR
jgi:hypothetical protein